MNNENNNYIVYKAVNNLNNQAYIGATTNSIYKRKLDHIEKANRGESNKFHNAINTYGTDAFEWEQIDTTNSVDELAQKEKQYIIEYNTKDEGYNSDSGGGFKKTVYQYDLASGKLINAFECLESAAKEVNTTKQHISRACLSVNKVLGGHFWSYEYNESFKPEKDARKREVLQFTIEGNSIANYVSVAQASKSTGLSKTCISRCCRGERKQSGGFLWKYI